MKLNKPWLWMLVMIAVSVALLFLGGCATHQQAVKLNRSISMAVGKSEILLKATEIR